MDIEMASNAIIKQIEEALGLPHIVARAALVAALAVCLLENLPPKKSSEYEKNMECLSRAFITMFGLVAKAQNHMRYDEVLAAFQFARDVVEKEGVWKVPS